MKNFQLFSLLYVVTVGAWAQPVAPRYAAPDQTPLEQRRAELRLMLKEPRAREAQDKEPDQRFENVAYDRHLSPQDRADLRQQLRQYRLEGKPEYP